MTLPKLPLIIGHRGAAHYAPENTLSSLYQAHQLGAQWVEFDVMLTRDNQAIIFHDATLERTTNGRGEVAHAYFDEIEQLDAGSWFDTDYWQQKIPTLEQWLYTAAQLKLGVNIELKDTAQRPEQLVALTLEALQRCWSPDLPLPLMSSGSIECLQALEQQAPQLAKGLITDYWLPQWWELLSALRCDSWHVDEALLNPERIRSVVTAGYGLLAFTVNDRRRAEQLWAWGVTSVFSDDPLL